MSKLTQTEKEAILDAMRSSGEGPHVNGVSLIALFTAIEALLSSRRSFCDPDCRRDVQEAQWKKRVIALEQAVEYLRPSMMENHNGRMIIMQRPFDVVDTAKRFEEYLNG